jgi:hypothetical protein
MMVLKYMLMLVLALGLAGRRMFDNVREWWSRVAAWLMIYSLAMLAVCGIVLFSPIIFDWIGDRLSAWVQGGVITGWLITLVSTLLLGKGESSSGTNEKKTPVLNLDNAALVVFLGLLFGAAWIVRFMLTPEGYSPQGNDPLLLNTLNGGYGGWGRFWLVFGGLLSSVRPWSGARSQRVLDEPLLPEPPRALLPRWSHASQGRPPPASLHRFRIQG